MKKVKKISDQELLEVCEKQFLKSFIYISWIHLAKSQKFKKAVRHLSTPVMGKGLQLQIFGAWLLANLVASSDWRTSYNNKNPIL